MKIIIHFNYTPILTLEIKWSEFKVNVYECWVDFEKEIMADKGKARPSDAGKCWKLS